MTIDLIPAVIPSSQSLRDKAKADRAARRAMPVDAATIRDIAAGIVTHIDETIKLPAEIPAAALSADELLVDTLYGEIAISTGLEPTKAIAIRNALVDYGELPAVTIALADICRHISVPSVRFSPAEMAAELLYKLSESDKGRAALKGIANDKREAKAYAIRAAKSMVNNAIRDAKTEIRNMTYAAGSVGTDTYRSEMEWAKAQAAESENGAMKYRSDAPMVIARDTMGSPIAWTTERALVARALESDGMANREDTDPARQFAFHKTFSTGAVSIMGTAYIAPTQSFTDNVKEANLAKWWKEGKAKPTYRATVGPAVGPAYGLHTVDSTMQTGITSAAKNREITSGSDVVGEKAIGTIRLNREQSLATLLTQTLRWKHVTDEEYTTDYDNGTLTSPLSLPARRVFFLRTFRGIVTDLALTWNGAGKESVRSAARRLPDLTVAECTKRANAYMKASRLANANANAIESVYGKEMTKPKANRSVRINAMGTKARAARKEANRARALAMLSVGIAFERRESKIDLATMLVLALDARESDTMRHIDALRATREISHIDRDAILAYLGLPIGAGSKAARGLFATALDEEFDPIGLFALAADRALSALRTHTDTTELRNAFRYARVCDKQLAYADRMGYRFPAALGRSRSPIAADTFRPTVVESPRDYVAIPRGPYSRPRIAAGTNTWNADTGRWDYVADGPHIG